MQKYSKIVREIRSPQVKEQHVILNDQCGRSRVRDGESTMGAKDYVEARSCWALQATERSLIAASPRSPISHTKVLFQDHSLSTKNVSCYWSHYCVFGLSKIPYQFTLTIPIHTHVDMGFY